MQGPYKALHDLAEMYWDSQDYRKSMQNKARSMTVDPVFVAMASKAYHDVEDQAAKDMAAELARVAPPEILEWVAESPGIGMELTAKLLGVIGDPYIAYPSHWEKQPGAKGGKKDPKRVPVEDPPFVRNLDKLWAYCGVGDPARKRSAVKDAEDKQAAAFALGNWKAKTTVYMMAVRILQGRRHYEGSKYVKVYDAARAEYEDHPRVHTEPCPQCKGSSQPGQPWKDGHQHAAALRKMGKEILRDLWEAARDAHLREAHQT